MSFHNQAFWTGNDDGDMSYGNASRVESKRTHQWFGDGTEVDLFPNKKQAVEGPNSLLLSGMVNPDVSSWGNSLGFHSLAGHFNEQLFHPNAATMSFEDANVASVSIDNKLSVERKDTMDPFRGQSTFGLSMSSVDDPRLLFSYDGVRKVEGEEAKTSDNVVSVTANNSHDMGVSKTVSNPPSHEGGDNSMSMSLTYNKEVANVLSTDCAYNRTDNNFMAMGQSYNKENDSLSIHPMYKEICNSISVGQSFFKVDSDEISGAQAYNNSQDNSVLTNHMFNKVDEGSISVSHTYHKEGDDVPFVSQSYNKGESTIISFGGCDDDDDTTPSNLLISNYEMLMRQAPSHLSEAVNMKELVRSCSNLHPSTAQTSVPETENLPKTKNDIKMSKKATSNNFPSNVRSLLSTGMLDGVSVKYKAWSREKELRGVIKGAGYLCSCQLCNFSKVINAYEFERHAGCKTKHPNNHIYFDNGKTIYGVVQELRSTPQSMLFEVIQTVTGSPINQKSYRIWKESFLAAARELQRICGKEVKQLL